MKRSMIHADSLFIYVFIYLTYYYVANINYTFYLEIKLWKLYYL